MRDGTHPRPPHSGTVFGDLLAAVSPETHAQFIANLRERTISAGTVLVDAGDDLDEFAVLQDGTLGLVQRLHDGRAHLIGFLTAPDVCGHPFDGLANCRIEALSDVRLLTMPRVDLVAVLDREPAVELYLNAHLHDILERSEGWLQMIGRRRIIERVATFLKRLANRGDVGGPCICR